MAWTRVFFHSPRYYHLIWGNSGFDRSWWRFIFFGIREHEEKKKEEKKRAVAQQEVNTQQESGSDEPVLEVDGIFEVSETILLDKTFRDYPFIQ